MNWRNGSTLSGSDDTVILFAVDHVQDFIAVERRVPWPGQTRQPNTRVDADDTSIHVWFEDAGDVTLSLDPIRWDDIEDIT